MGKTNRPINNNLLILKSPEIQGFLIQKITKII